MGSSKKAGLTSKNQTNTRPENSVKTPSQDYLNVDRKKKITVSRNAIRLIAFSRSINNTATVNPIISNGVYSATSEC